MKEARARVVNAVKVISSGIVGWGIYAYSTGLFNHHSADNSAAVQRSVFITGLYIVVTLGYFNVRKK